MDEIMRSLHTDPNFKPYHSHGTNARAYRVSPETRPFIAWDGEGMNLRGAGKPQSYVLFGCSTGDCLQNARGLHTNEILEFIVSVAERHPTAFHVGFAFTYDVNMIVKNLPPSQLKTLYENGYVRIFYKGACYGVSYRRGKSFTVTKYRKGYKRDGNPSAKTTVTIYDIFSFFGTSFLKTVENMLGANATDVDVVTEGKAQRGEFHDLEYVYKYWLAEIKLLAEVAEELRKRLYGAGLRIKQWHGPGALASFAMKQHGVKAHLKQHNDAIRMAARYAYAGGRFELFKVGRTTKPIYSIDINSAYPHAIAQLPSMTEGEWVYEETPKRLATFGVYHVRQRTGAGFGKPPAPLFHRDQNHNISYPWVVEGWYWSPEAKLVWNDPTVEIVEGYHYIGYNSKPFAWVEDMYEQRRAWKEAGNESQIALKLCMNSLYGKMAQRVGYSEKDKRIPPWHQLEWAGWVTAKTRATLYRIMRQIPWNDLIAVETDGIYTTTSPDELGITASDKLGGWSVDQYDEILYFQSGLAWMRQGDNWFGKKRGLDADSFKLEDAIAYVQTLKAGEKWKPYVARATRFVGIGAALASSEPLTRKHCVWETTDREIIPGEKGKRIHVPQFCNACRENADANERLHDLVIRSLSKVGELSTPHNIPWEGNDDKGDWREYAITVEDLVSW